MTGGPKGNDGVLFGIRAELDTMDVGNWGLGMPTNEFSPDAICLGPDGWEDPEGGIIIVVAGCCWGCTPGRGEDVMEGVWWGWGTDCWNAFWDMDGWRPG